MIQDHVRSLQKSIRHDPDLEDISGELLASLAFVHDCVAARKSQARRIDPGMDERARQAMLQGDSDRIVFEKPIAILTRDSFVSHFGSRSD